MKNSRFELAIFLLVGLGIFPGCRSEEVKSSAQPPSAASPSPAYNPGFTDLNRVKAGTLAPDFQLEDMNGRTVRLSEYRGRKYVVLIFYRGYF